MTFRYLMSKPALCEVWESVTTRSTDAMVAYTYSGRIPGTARHWPRWLLRLLPCALSDNVLIIGRRPAAGLSPAIDRANNL